MKFGGKMRKLIWQLVLVAGFIVEIIMIAVSVVSIAKGGYEFSFGQTIAFVAIAVWIYVAYLKQKHVDVSKDVVDEKIKTHALIENLREGVMIVDGGNRMLLCNPVAARLLGLSAIEWLGKDFTSQVDEAVRQVFKSGQGGEIEGVPVSGKGRVRFQIIKLPGNRDGEEYRLVYVSAAMAVESPPPAAVSCSHLSRTAETISCMRVELLKVFNAAKDNRESSTELGKLIVRSIAENVILGAETVNGMVRQKSLGGVVKKSHFPVTRLWSAIPAELLAVARAAGVSIEIPSSAGDELKIDGDADFLVTAMKQVLCNAVLAAMPGGKVAIRAGSMGSNIGVAVIDSGTPVAQDAIDCLYSESYDGIPANDGSKTRTESIGYYLARGIVEAHNGVLTLESPVEGGLRVMMMLPGA